MNRRQVVMGAVVAPSALLPTPKPLASKLGSITMTTNMAVQTNSEIPPPSFETLPWGEVMYVGVLATWYDLFRDSLATFFDGIASLSENVTSDPLQVEIVGGIGVWTHLYADVTNVEPPDPFKEAHKHFLSALTELNVVAQSLSLGVVRGNADLLTSSIDSLDSANASLRSFVASLPYAVPDRRELSL